MAARVIKIEIPIETQDKTDPALGNVKTKLEDLDAAAEKAKKSMTGFEKSLGSTAKKASGFEKLFGRREWKVLLEAKDKITPTVKQVLILMKSLSGKAWKVTLKAVDLVTSPVRRVYGLLKSPLVAAGVTISAGAGITSTVKTYADFESAMSQVKAISGATGEEFAQLTEKAKQMGAVTKFTASESAEAFTYMAQAGWSARDMMDGIEGLMSLAAASGESLGTTSDIVTDALTAFGLSAKDSGKFADVMAQASNATNTDVAKMGETFKYVAPVAGALGYSIEDTAVAIGLMANNGIKASQAGTSLRSLLTNLTRPVGEAEDAINDLSLSITNTDGSVKPLAQTMQELRDKFSGLTEAQKTQYAAMLAGQEGMSGLLAIVNASDADFRKLTDEINNSSGAAKQMSDIMMDNLAGKFELFTGALDSMKMSLGEKIKPYLADALDWLTEKVPDVENALLSAMNSVDHFVENTKAKIDEFTATDEWKNADLFGKVRIAWDELVAEPFSEWWNGSGKVQIAGVARDIGTGIGTAISAGILTLMGIDVSSVIDEGNSIGRQFAEGFKEGMSGVDVSAVLGTLATGAMGAISSAGKFLPGGQAPDIGSLLSAVAISKVAGPLLSFGGKVIGAGKKAFDYKDVIMGSAATGTGLKGLAASAGMIGLKLGSGATTGAGLIASGVGGVAGGVAGGAALVSGGLDAYKAIKSENEEEKAVYAKSAGLKVGGVAAGAAAGAAIGSVVPVLGTAVGGLIGAGIGGIAGWLGGNKVKEDYKEAVDEAELLAEKSKYALEGAKFEAKELGDAFEDTNVSAAEFANMMQEATANKIKDNFGDIKLSMQEIGEAAKQIVFGDQEKSMTKFTGATNDAKTSFSNLQNALSTMDKLNWKASLGMKFDENDISEYMAGVDGMIQSASQYLENKHYEAKAAIDLLVEPGGDVDMMAGLNTMYSDLQEKVESFGTDLKAKVNVALEDGVITLDEQKEISNLQNQITEITNQISQAEAEASFQSLKIKYSGAALDADSFANLVAEVQKNVQEMASSYDEALQISLTNLNLQLANGAITQEQFDQQFKEITEGYQAKITDLTVRVESFELQSIADAFGSELDGILPDLEGSVAERLGTAMHNAMSNGVDVENWDIATATEWLDLEGVSAETQAALTEMMSQVAASLPDQMTSALEGADLNMGDGINSIINSSIENADFSEAGAAMQKKLGESLTLTEGLETDTGIQNGIQTSILQSVEGADFSEAGVLLNQKFGESLSLLETEETGTGMQEGLQASVLSAVENVDLSEVGALLNQKMGESMSSVDMSESGAGLQEGIQSSLTAALEGIDLSGVASTINTSLAESFASVESVDMSGFSAAMQEGINTSVSGLDYSSVTTAVGTGVSSAITASMSTIQGSIDSLYSSVGAAINSAFAAGFQTTTTVTITVNYQLANPSATISFGGGGSGTATVSGSISSNANGGYSNGPELTLWGEDGPEVIIPLGSKRRSRGLELWMQAGEILGVHKNANGGITRGTGFSGVLKGNDRNLETPYEQVQIPETDKAIHEEETDAETYHVTSIPEKRTPNKTEIHLNMEVNPQFVVSGGNEDNDVLRMIREHMGELADDMSGAIYQKLKNVFENMPVSSI